MATDGVSGAAVVSFAQMQGMDIESMLMAVQGNRANLLEEQLVGEMKNVQAKNAQIASLNAKLSALTGVSQMAYFNNDTTPAAFLTGIIDLSFISKEDPAKTQTGRLDAARAVAVEPEVLTAADVAWNATLDTIKTKGVLDRVITDLKAQVDGMGSTQQMDMLRLQSLSNKRNEAFDLMTNFMKKFADKRDAIISNMR